MKKRTGDAFMSPPDYGRSLKGFGVNLLVRDVERSVAYLTDVLALEAVYSDPDFAVLRHQGTDIILHADHTYGAHPLLTLTGDGALRGAGCELRLYGIDPDMAEARARELANDMILAASADKPHGLRECYITDQDGYVWVPAVASTE